MKTVEEYLRLLSVGPLSSLALSGEGSGFIREKELPRVILAMNEALIRIYTRFSLLEKDLILEQQSHITRYHLDKSKAYVQGTSIDRYIVDGRHDAFDNDIVQINAVFDMNGCRYVLNDPSDCESLYTPSPTVLQIPFPEQGKVLSVQYQALHPKLYGEGDVLLAQNIDITTEALEAAFLYYVAYLVYLNMNTPESGAKSMEFLQLYESVCEEVQGKTLEYTGNAPRYSKFHIRGFK